MKCENCEKEHNGQYENQRFCSKFCGRSFSTKAKQIKKGKCKNCKVQLKKNQKLYCGHTCQQIYRHTQYIVRWKNGLEDGRKGKSGFSKHLKRYLRETFGDKCSICDWAEINPKSGTIPIALDHIDGNWKNNMPDNLRLLCPNCHALTETYCSLNIGNGRPRY